MSSDPQSTSVEVPPFAKWPEGVEIKTYKGGCHCRKFTYEFSHPSLDVKKPLSCNCTFCTKTGALNVYGPQKMLRFDGNSASRAELSTFKAKLLPTTHHFCPGCGNYLFWEGKGLVGVNARMFDGIELEKLSVDSIDGRSKDS